MAHWIGVQGPSKFVKKPKTPPLCEPIPGQNLTQIKKCIFNRTKKTCCIRRGFEQLPSYSGWLIITKKARSNLLARAVVKGFQIASCLRAFPLLWNFASPREWDFTAQQFWWSWVFAHSEGTLLRMQCKWTTNRFILSTLQRKCPCYGNNHKKTLRWQQ